MTRKISYPNLLKALKRIRGGQTCWSEGDLADSLNTDMATLAQWEAEATNFSGPKKYVITSAQSCTDINESFWISLNKYCLANEAELCVIPYSYNAGSSERWWHPWIEPFLDTRRRKLCKGLQLMTDYTRAPTTQNPLASRDTCTGSDSGIFPHAKVALKPVPTPSNDLPKLLWTTGSLTLPRYTDSAAGKLGEFHHSIAALAVHVERGKFHVRNLIADDNDGFYDLDKYYSADDYRENCRAAGLVMGDSHIKWIDPAVVKATFKADGIMDVIQPRNLYWHDILDQYARNHHHRDNWVVNHAKYFQKIDNVKNEVDDCINFLNENTPSNCQSYIVPSNHNDALKRWVMESDFKEDPENAEFLLEMQLAMVKAVRTNDRIDPFSYYSSDKTDAIFLERDESHELLGIELGFHGDQGANGARGSLRSFSKIGPKTITGHTHRPEILHGAWSVGTSSLLDLEYTKGLSNWVHSHIVVYPNGKRSHIHIIKGNWR
jgi:hypothetical protein